MNHDATHCADHTGKCPASCYRAQLTRELKTIHYFFNVSWAHFKGAEECPLDLDKEEIERLREELSRKESVDD